MNGKMRENNEKIDLEQEQKTRKARNQGQESEIKWRARSEKGEVAA